MDFVVDFEKKSFDGYMDLKAFLEELFQCRVDVVVADAVKPPLRAATTEITMPVLREPLPLVAAESGSEPV